jgi:hypothetical protein
MGDVRPGVTVRDQSGCLAHEERNALGFYLRPSSAPEVLGSIWVQENVCQLVGESLGRLGIADVGSNSHCTHAVIGPAVAPGAIPALDRIASRVHLNRERIPQAGRVVSVEQYRSNVGKCVAFGLRNIEHSRGCETSNSRM